MWGGNADGEDWKDEKVVVLAGMWVDLTQPIWSL